jgi:hypothetical protein
LISVELVAKVEEEACRLARQTASGGQGEVRGNQEIVDVFGVNFPGDSNMVAGRASVAENSALVGGCPHETKDSRIDGRGGGPQVVEGELFFGVSEDFGDVETRGGVVADGNNCSGDHLGRR